MAVGSVAASVILYSPSIKQDIEEKIKQEGKRFLKDSSTISKKKLQDALVDIADALVFNPDVSFGKPNTLNLFTTMALVRLINNGISFYEGTDTSRVREFLSRFSSMGGFDLQFPEYQKEVRTAVNILQKRTGLDGPSRRESLSAEAIAQEALDRANKDYQEALAALVKSGSLQDQQALERTIAVRNHARAAALPSSSKAIAAPPPPDHKGILNTAFAQIQYLKDPTSNEEAVRQFVACVENFAEGSVERNGILTVVAIMRHRLGGKQSPLKAYLQGLLETCSPVGAQSFYQLEQNSKAGKSVNPLGDAQTLFKGRKQINTALVWGANHPKISETLKVLRNSSSSNENYKINYIRNECKDPKRNTDVPIPCFWDE